MAQHTTPADNPEIESTVDETSSGCCHHWVIQPADGPISNGSCQVCGETREFKNYVEAATWGDSRTSSKGSAASDTAEPTSDDEDIGSQDTADEGPDPHIDPDDSDMESVD